MSGIPLIITNESKIFNGVVNYRWFQYCRIYECWLEVAKRAAERIEFKVLRKMTPASIDFFSKNVSFVVMRVQNEALLMAAYKTTLVPRPDRRHDMHLEAIHKGG